MLMHPEASPGAGSQMKSLKSAGLNRPFEILGDLFAAEQLRWLTAAPPPSPAAPPEAPPVSDETLFFEAMAGVQRMHWNGIEPTGRQPADAGAVPLPEEYALEELRRLVKDGQGFHVADTPEYMEGIGCPAPPEITRRLHRGDFSVQAHLDLHGFGAAAAQELFDGFMREAVAAGMRTVLIIHGRGLSSPALPVLKTRGAEWLTTGYWRKWVVAFASARRCDGGSGACYVLLRRRPLPKRWRKR